MFSDNLLLRLARFTVALSQTRAFGVQFVLGLAKNLTSVFIVFLTTFREPIRCWMLYEQVWEWMCSLSSRCSSSGSSDIDSSSSLRPSPDPPPPPPGGATVVRTNSARGFQSLVHRIDQRDQNPLRWIQLTRFTRSGLGIYRIWPCGAILLYARNAFQD